MVNIRFLVQRLLLTIIICSVLQAQKVNCQETQQKIKYSSINELGLLSGERGEALTVQTINGIKKGKSFAGAGVGLDFYAMRSVPLFADFRRDFSSAKNTPFAYADIGADFLWLPSSQKPLQALSKTGWYYDVGLGWKLSGKEHRGFVISAGYTLKQARYDVPSHLFSPFSQLQEENNERYSFLYKRLVIKIGFQL